MSFPARVEHRYSRDLDGARGILAFCVVLLHFGFNSFFARVSHGVFGGAVFQLSVDAFFILSGYVLTTSVARSRPTPGQFMRKRFFRLDPVFFLTTAPALLVPGPDYVWRLAMLEVVAGLPLLGHDAANGPSWSVSWEFYLPVIAYAASARLPRFSRSVSRVALAVAVVAIALLDYHVMLENVLYFPRAACGLLAGHFLCNAQLERVVRWQSWMNPALLAAALLIMVAASVALMAGIVFPVIVCCLVLSAATHDSRLLSARAVQWLGSISYTLYMIHMPVLLIGHALLGRTVEQNAVAKLGGIAISVVAAALLTRFVERPFIDYAKRKPPEDRSTSTS